MKANISTKRPWLAAATGTLLAASMLGACGSSSPNSSKSTTKTGGGSPVAELVMESSPETTITRDFNPYVSTAAPQGMGATGLIYEPLIEFDVAAPPKYYRWLATSYKWANAGKSIVFSIRSGVKWSDGKPLTPADVVFTFEEMKRYPAINLDGLNISSVTSSGNKVTINFPTAQYANLQAIAGAAIMPEHVWAKVGNPTAYEDANPVGTGPYMLSSFTPEGYTLKTNPNYWQKSLMPKIPEIYFPVYTSNTTALTALYAGKIDWTGNFIPGLQKNFVDTNKKYHHYWEAAGSTNALDVNIHTWPTNQLPVRQAMSAALDRTVLADEGEDGLESPALNASGLTLPTFAAWSGPVKSMTVPAGSDAAKAKSIMEKAGYTLKGGYFYKDGKEVSVTLTSPTSYTDYAAVASLAAEELGNAGIKATFKGLSVNSWEQDMSDGSFSVAEHWSNSGITPYNLYDNWLDSNLVAGKSATGDYERLDDPTINADLAKLSAAPTTAAQTMALAPIAKYVADQLPVVPITTASEWFEYNSQNFVGWPTQADPYETGQPSGTNNGPASGTDLVVVLHLSPRK